jgi:hypothetical protein
VVVDSRSPPPLIDVPMLTFLFWNLCQNPLQEMVANLAFHHEVDVLMLAECRIRQEDLLEQLNKREARFEAPDPDSQCHRIVILTRFPRQSLVLRFESDKFTVRELRLGDERNLLLAVVHFPSRLYQSERSLNLQVIEFGARLRDIENTLGHRRTILVGDLNLNPFEEGVACATGLHGVMTRELALRKTRTVQMQEYPFFYNPMWGQFGDRDNRPPGTYYYSHAEQLTYFWNIFDQVLIRPELLPHFRNEDLQILATDGTTSFLSAKGLPNQSAASDHLPILFRLDL